MTGRLLSRTTIDRALVLVAVLLVWELASLGAGSYWVASPWATLRGLAESIQDGSLAFQGSYTLRATLIGIVIGGVPGVVIPVLLRPFARVQAVLEPFFMAGYGIPKVAIAPLFIVIFGIDLESKIAVVASAVFFIVLISTQSGIQAAQRGLVDMSRIAGANAWQVGWHVVLPGAVPFVLSGFRIAVPYAISSVVITELISSNRGLGFMIQSSATDFNTRGVFVALLAITLLALAANMLVALIERRLLAWRPPVVQAEQATSMG